MSAWIFKHRPQVCSTKYVRLRSYSIKKCEAGIKQSSTFNCCFHNLFFLLTCFLLLRLCLCSNCGFRPVLSEQSAVAAAAAAAAAQRSAANHPPLFLPPHLAAQFSHQPLFPGLKGEWEGSKRGKGMGMCSQRGWGANGIISMDALSISGGKSKANANQISSRCRHKNNSWKSI